MPNTYVNLQVHFIFSTKNREPMIDETLQPKLYSYMGGIFKQHQSKLITAGGMPDHVHLLVSTHTQTAIATLMREVESASSRWVHEKYRDRAFAWQVGYAAFSVSQSSTDAVCTYIANQAEHHREISFEEELITFLERHGVSYDPRYLEV